MSGDNVAVSVYRGRTVTTFMSLGDAEFVTDRNVLVSYPRGSRALRRIRKALHALARRK
jgi:hypothetical protein